MWHRHHFVGLFALLVIILIIYLIWNNQQGKQQNKNKAGYQGPFGDVTVPVIVPYPYAMREGHKNKGNINYDGTTPQFGTRKKNQYAAPAPPPRVVATPPFGGGNLNPETPQFPQ